MALIEDRTEMHYEDFDYGAADDDSEDPAGSY